MSRWCSVPRPPLADMLMEAPVAVPRGVIPAPAVRSGATPGRFGDLSRARSAELIDLAGTVWDSDSDQQSMRRVGVRLLLEHLERFDGDTWTERWQAGGLDVRGCPVADLGGPAGSKSTLRMRVASGFRSLVCLRVVQPSLVALRSNKVVDLARALQVAETTLCSIGSLPRLTGLDGATRNEGTPGTTSPAS
jgi:hypothetical protein